MRLEITSEGNFDGTLAWLKGVPNKTPTTTMNRLGREGVAALMAATPRGETGLTALGWRHMVTIEAQGPVLSFYNIAHPEAGVNVARLIQLGHGTGTGGYVPPINYIRPALEPIYKRAGDLLAKEVAR